MVLAKNRTATSRQPHASPLTHASPPQPTPIDGVTPSAAPDHPHAAQATLAAMDSRALFQGQKAVAIHHNGSVYRLQATKLGKLILTK